MPSHCRLHRTGGRTAVTRTATTALLLLAIAPCWVQAQVFKCVDAQGQVAYQDTPCPTGAAQSTQALRGVYYRCESPDGSTYLRLDGCVSRVIGGESGRITRMTDDAGRPVLGRESEVPPHVGRWYDPRRRQWVNIEREQVPIRQRVDPGRPVTPADACADARAARRRIESDPDRTLDAIRAAEAAEARACMVASTIGQYAAEAATDPSRSGWSSGNAAPRRDTTSAQCDIARANLAATERDPDRTMGTIRAAQASVDQACRGR